MTINAEDRDRIVKWLEQKCGQMRCTCCGHARWELLELATLPIGIDLRSTRFYYSQGILQVTIACTNCGHMLFFNPAIMGIKPDEPPVETAGA